VSFKSLRLPASFSREAFLFFSQRFPADRHQKPTRRDLSNAFFTVTSTEIRIAVEFDM